MDSEDLIHLGIPPGEALKIASAHMQRLFGRGLNRGEVEAELKEIVRQPGKYLDDPEAGELARALKRPGFVARPQPAPWRQWGSDLEPAAVQQMENACRLPVAVAGALMPDAHVGYGLPIGGVLATEKAVVPYAVGVDIACRMRLTVFAANANLVAGQKDRLANIIERETRFGVGCTFRERREHQVMDEDWKVSPVTERMRDKAWSQLGTSGSGNHFVEFGAFTINDHSLGLPPGEHLALLTHSGSRGAGAQVCQHYSRLAMQRHPELPKELKHLAWLSLQDEDGQEYWGAMNLMGRYAAANHEVIHQHIARPLGEDVLFTVENHHNFAWQERHVIDGVDRDVIVHRKGATPAGAGVLGVIPGSMAAPGFLVRGKGEPASLESASHGAGRVMSRTKAFQSFTWSAVKKQLQERGITLLSAGLDEVPGVYKDIATVIAAQTDLVELVGRFDPKLVKMCPAGERPED